MKTIQVGDTVRFTGRFLRNTGQQVGGEGQSRWVIQACSCGLCKTGRYVATDQPSEYDAELEIGVGDALRHIASGNLEVVRTVQAVRCQKTGKALTAKQIEVQAWDGAKGGAS